MLLLALCLKYNYFFSSHLKQAPEPVYVSAMFHFIIQFLDGQFFFCYHTWILCFKSQTFLFSKSSSEKRVCSNELPCLQALSEEKVAYERSTSRNIYLNVAVNTLKKLRSLVPNSPSSTNSTYHICGLIIGALLGLEATERNLLKRQTHFSEALCWKANKSS